MQRLAATLAWELEKSESRRVGAGGRASAHLEPDLLGKSLVEGARAAGCVQAHLRRQGPTLGYRDMTLSWHGSEQLIRQSSEDNKGKQPAAWAFVGIAAGITAKTITSQPRYLLVFCTVPCVLLATKCTGPKVCARKVLVSEGGALRGRPLWSAPGCCRGGGQRAPARPPPPPPLSPAAALKGR